MERQRRSQETIAEEMMTIARSLKDNALTAKNIIIGDNQVSNVRKGGKKGGGVM